MAVSPVLRVTGTKLSVMNQSLAYKAICERKMKLKLKKRDRTVINIKKTKAEVEDAFGFPPIEARIWKSIINKYFSRPKQNLLWKTMHGACGVGTHWL